MILSDRRPPFLDDLSIYGPTSLSLLTTHTSAAGSLVKVNPSPTCPGTGPGVVASPPPLELTDTPPDGVPITEMPRGESGAAGLAADLVRRTPRTCAFSTGTERSLRIHDSVFCVLVLEPFMRSSWFGVSFWLRLECASKQRHSESGVLGMRNQRIRL